MTSRDRLEAHIKPIRFLVFGHRGAAGLAPENTLTSFARALTLNVPMIELDVHRSGDSNGQLMVIHDDTVDRTTNGKGRVADFSAEELGRLDAGQGDKVPSFAEVTALVARHNERTSHPSGINIELKGARTAEPTVRALQSIGTIPCIVSSFDIRELETFRNAAPDVAVAPLFNKWQDDAVEVALRLRATSINWSTRLVSGARVRKAKDAGLKVFVYTVNRLSEALELEALGVDGIFSDRPDRMKEWLPQA